MTDKLPLNPDMLTPGDLKRARVALDGGNVWEMLNDPLDAMILTIWCLRSRDDPGFSFEQAENTPLGEFDMGDANPPPIPGNAANGDSPGSNESSTLPLTPTSSAPAPP